MDIEKLREDRYKFLNLLYKVTDGDEYKFTNMFDLGSELYFDRSLTSRIAKYLDGEGLMKFRTLGGGIGITHFGIKEIERSQTEPTSSSRYFPSVNNIAQPVNYHLHVENMHNSQIQQGANNSSQSLVVTENDLNGIRDLVNDITKYIDDIGLEEVPRNELETQVEMLSAQLKSSQPNKLIISEVLGSLRRVIEGASGNLIATGILAKIGSLLVGGV